MGDEWISFAADDDLPHIADLDPSAFTRTRLTTPASARRRTRQRFAFLKEHTLEYQIEHTESTTATRHRCSSMAARSLSFGAARTEPYLAVPWAVSSSASA